MFFIIAYLSGVFHLLRQFLLLVSIDEEERRAVIRYLNNQECKRERVVKAAMDKIRIYYLAAIPAPRRLVGTW